MLMAFATATNFAIEQNSYALRNTWILRSGADLHVCNDPSQVTCDCLANEDHVLIAGKTMYYIEAFGSVVIKIRTPSGSKQITLLKVALVPASPQIQPLSIDLQLKELIVISRSAPT
jgi:hypothetical protein